MGEAPVFDLKIVNGRIIDGTGSPAYHGSLGIRNGRLAEVGDADGSATETLDARGNVVCPGFIDIHTHYDVQLFWDPLLTISPYHGVTTAVIGNCGFGIAPTRPDDRELILRTLARVEGMPYECTSTGMGAEWPFVTFPEYLNAIERRGLGINVGALIGHTPVRTFVMGDDASRRAATDAEIDAMRHIVREAVEAGAFGLASSDAPSHAGPLGRPVPSRCATYEEHRALLRAMGEVGRGVFEVTLGPVLTLASLERLMQETGRPITYAGLVVDARGKGSHEKEHAEVKRIQEAGHPLLPQVSPRALTFAFSLRNPSMLSRTAPGALNIEHLDELFEPIVEQSDDDVRLTSYRDPAFRLALREMTDSPQWRWLWERTYVTEVPGRPDLTDCSLGQLAEQHSTHPADVLVSLGVDSDLEATFAMKFINTDPEAVLVLLRDPGTRIGLSDGGAHVSEVCDACYATDLLGTWVRERGDVQLEEAIWWLTQQSAEVYGISDRGTLEPGLAADVVVLDPQTVAAGPLRRVEDLPAGATRLVSDAQGIDYVVVNGQVLLDHGRRVGDSLPGRLLRSGTR